MLTEYPQQLNSVLNLKKIVLGVQSFEVSWLWVCAVCVGLWLGRNWLFLQSSATPHAVSSVQRVISIRGCFETAFCPNNAGHA